MLTDPNALAAKAWEDAERAGEDAYIEAVQTGVASSDIAMAKGAVAAQAAIAAVYAPRLAELEAEVERLDVTVSAAEQRASQSEHRLHSFRRSRASTSKALSEFIKARAPELWPDYAAVSVNKSVYTDDYTQEPTWEREMNILLYRAEKAEEELAAARAALGASHDADA